MASRLRDRALPFSLSLSPPPFILPVRNLFELPRSNEIALLFVGPRLDPDRPIVFSSTVRLKSEEIREEALLIVRARLRVKRADDINPFDSKSLAQEIYKGELK